MNALSLLRRHGASLATVFAIAGSAAFALARPRPERAGADVVPRPGGVLQVGAGPVCARAPALHADAPSGVRATPTLSTHQSGLGPLSEVGQVLSGRVVEQIDVENYSYLRLERAGQGGTWAAVPAAPSQVGREVTISNAELMTNFVSATLARTFETIHFGLLGATPPVAPDPAAHEEASRTAGPHPGPGRAADQVPISSLPRAERPLGKTIAEINALGAGATGTVVRLRAVVVKSTPGVLGRTFLHVRDGSGEAARGTHDLTVTTDAEPAVRDTVLLEGTVEVDKDFGAGYRYSVLLSNAKVLPDRPDGE